MDRVRDLDLLAVDQDLAARVGLIGAREHLHQRALAGAILTHQRQDLAAPGPELHVVERLEPGKVFEMLRISRVGTPAPAVVMDRASLLVRNRVSAQILVIGPRGSPGSG